MMIRKIASLMVLSSILGCGFTVSSSRAAKAAEDEGYSNVVVTSRHFISPNWVGGCSEDDDAAFSAMATNVAHRRVEIKICCGHGLGKGCTVRH